MKSTLSLSALALALFTTPAVAHRGVSDPMSMDQAAVNDAYRYPNRGVCHGATSGGTSISGVQNFKLGNGVSHGGGPCKVFHCPVLPPLPACTRKVINTPAGCTEVVSTNDCSVSTTMDPFNADAAGFYMWIWTPISSGSCEIYMNCWTSAATGSGGGGGGVTPVTPVAGTSTVRCGTSWLDANGKCGTPCTSDAQCEGTFCWADLRECKTETGPAPVAPCRAVGAWSGFAGMDALCLDRCPADCPATHCTCAALPQGSVVGQVLAPRVAEAKYVPKCETHTTATDQETLASIVTEYDLSSPYSTLATEPEEAAIKAMFKFNNANGVKLESETGKLPKGTKVFLLGDCQLTMGVDKTDINSASTPLPSAMLSALGFALYLVLRA